MHGEHPLTDEEIAIFEGSSPYARGALSQSDIARKLGGIIPVCTGSTLIVRSWTRFGRDHPRMHGEHGACCGLRLCLRGSSPYARGALIYQGDEDCGQGIIPVCTGSTTSRVSST